MVVCSAVEGLVDDAVIRRLLQVTGHDVGPVHIKNGKPAILDKLAGYNAAAQLTPWLVLVDLNGDAQCAPAFIAKHLRSPAERMLFRVAVPQVESWFLADRVGFARFLRVSQARLPRQPDSLTDSKRTVVELARHSSDRVTREEVVPRLGSGRRVGPAYVARMIEFVGAAWKPDEAATRSESLRRCLAHLRALQ